MTIKLLNWYFTHFTEEYMRKKLRLYTQRDYELLLQEQAGKIITLEFVILYMTTVITNVSRGLNVIWKKWRS
jgi:hypothetical protein